MNLNEFCLRNLDNNIALYVNNEKYYSGIGRNLYTELKKTIKEFSYFEVLKYSNVEENVKIDEEKLIFYITMPNLIMISTHLYGGKSIFSKGSSPYELEIRKCEKANSCSLYKNGMCASVKRLSHSCPYAIKTLRSASYKSQKGEELHSKYLDMSKNNTINEFDGYFWSVDDKYCFYLPYIKLCRHKETKEFVLRQDIPFYNIDDYAPVDASFEIPKEEASKKFFDMIFEAHPISLMGGEITNYQEVIVPRLKIDILKSDFNLAKMLNIEALNYVGKKAVLKTLKPGITCYDRTNKYQLCWDGETVEILNSEALCSSLSIGKYASGNIRLIPSDDLVVIIADNNWVLPTTEFKEY